MKGRKNTLLKSEVIAEACCNHMGDMQIARQMIFAAAKCGVDVIKFQKRNVRELLTEEQYYAPHPVPANAFGASYGLHREFLEFSLEQHRQLMEWCGEANVEYSASVWDLTSAREIASLRPDKIKVPSACNNHFPMLEWLCINFQGELHISLGMTTRREEAALIALLDRYQRLKDTVLYICTSGYPVDYQDICLLEIERIKMEYGHQLKKIGFSGHHLGCAVDIAAQTLGASVIERHFTLDKSWKGTDQSASLNCEELTSLIEGLRQASLAMSSKPDQLLPVERVQRSKLKYRGEGAVFSENSHLPETAGKIKMILTDCDGVLTDGGMYYGESGEEFKRFHARDGMGFQLLRERQILTGIVTGEQRELLIRRAEKLQADELHMNVRDKFSIVKEIAKKRGLLLSEIAFIGDDVNDLECMSHCGFCACPADAVSEVRNHVDYICRRQGGQGAFREVADMILKSGES